MPRVRERWFTFESDPLFAESRSIRLRHREKPETPVKPSRPDRPSQRRGPKSGPFRRRDTAQWEAIRKDSARGLPRRVIMEIYGVDEREYHRALQAGKEA